MHWHLIQFIASISIKVFHRDHTLQINYTDCGFGPSSAFLNYFFVLASTLVNPVLSGRYTPGYTDKDDIRIYFHSAREATQFVIHRSSGTIISIRFLMKLKPNKETPKETKQTQNKYLPRVNHIQAELCRLCYSSTILGQSYVIWLYFPGKMVLLSTGCRTKLFLLLNLLTPFSAFISPCTAQMSWIW